MTDAPQPRYAVYYAPPADSGLWRLAQAWLGRDCETGQLLPQPALDGWSAAEITAATESPRYYGFHATLKAPLRLRAEISAADLRAAITAFAARQRPFRAPPLKVSTIGSFIALTFSAPALEMQALADAAVRELDCLRAPLTADEIERRLEGGLTSRQEDLLRSWGYPYVFEEFRFHMTLTGSNADAGRRERLQTQLASLFRPVLAEPVPVTEICLYSQAHKDRPFQLVERFPLGAATTGGASAEGEAIA